MRVVTFNICDGGKGREHLILDVLRNAQPDIILLQEITYPELVYELASQLNMKFAIASGFTHRRVAILTSYPILSCDSYSPVPKLSRDVLAATIEYKPNKAIQIFCVHLAAQPFLFFEWLRIIEVRSILRRILQNQPEVCLIAGDFNAVAPADVPIKNSLSLIFRTMLLLQGNRFLHNSISKLLSSGFFDSYRCLHDDGGYTLPPLSPSIRFDYIFVNKALYNYLQKCFVLAEYPATEFVSDHYPVVADFDL